MQTFMQTRKKKKKKSHYTVLVVSESSTEAMKQYSISLKVCKAIACITIVLLMVGVAGTTLAGILLNGGGAKASEWMIQVGELKMQNEQLALQNEQLNSKVSILSDTVNQKVEQEAVVAAEQEEKSMPKGFPLSGTATMEEQEAPANPIAVFVANQGVNVIASGSGIVETVGLDEEYTNIIKINHGNGYTSIYRSEAEVKVKQGEEVLRGTVLYQMNVNEQKIAYQIQLNNEYVEPMDIMEIYG